MNISFTPKVSVIIPAYNAERTIRETINSVLEQTFFDFELIIINDGSTDNTLQLVNEVKDSRLRVYSYSNAGLSMARNRGITHAKGEYISFIDADDLWTSDKLEMQVQALEKSPTSGVAYSWTMCMDNSGKVFYPGVIANFQGNVYSHLLISNFIASGSNVLIRAEAIKSVGEFDITLKSCEDWDYWLRLAPKWNFVVVPKSQIIYRLSSGAMSSKVEVMEKYQILVLERAFKKAPPELQHLKNKGFSYIYQYLTQLYLTRVDTERAVQKATIKLFKCILLNPAILMNKKTQILATKILMIWLLTPKIATYAMRLISSNKSIVEDPRLKKA
jgi:glycosyltransferase involved in cell wall biosynthesis